MASRIKGITIEIDGNTTPLTKALKSVNGTISKTQTELKDVNKLLKLDPNNTQLLQQKQGLLAEAIKATSAKLDEEKKALEQLKQSGNTEQTQEQQRALEREIIATEQSLEKLAKESIDTDNALDGLGDESEKTAKDLDKTKEKGEGLKKALVAVGKGAAVMAAATAAAVAKVTKEMVNASIDTAKYADEILTLSAQTGVATDKLQAYNYAAELVDVSTETITKSMAKNIKSMSSAAQGSDKMVAAYDKLGISVKNADGSLRDSETVYWEAIDALKGVKNETERDAIAMQIFGKSAQELNPLIEKGSAGMKELTDEAKEAGAVLSDDQLADAGAFDDAIQRLKSGAGAAKNAVGMVLIPALTQLSTDGKGLLNDFTKGIVEADGDMSKIGTVIGDALSGAIGLITKNLPQILNIGTGIVDALLSGIIKTLPSIITTVVQFIPQITGIIVKLIPQLTSALLGTLPLLIGAITTLITQLLPQLSTMLPQIVEQIIQVVPLLVNALINAIPQLLTGAVQFLTAIIDALPEIMRMLNEVLPQVVETITKFLIAPKTLKLLLKSAITLLTSIIKAVPQIVSSLNKVIPSIISAITHGLKAGLSAVGAAAKELGNKIKEKIKDKIADAKTWGKDLIDNFVSGIKNSIHKITDAMKKIGQKIKDLIGFSEPKEGPLSNFHTYAPDMIDLFSEGILKSLPTLQKAVGQMAMTIDGGGTVTNNRNVTVNQYNSYSAPHSQYELWQSRQDLTRTIKNTVRGAV